MMIFDQFYVRKHFIFHMKKSAVLDYCDKNNQTIKFLKYLYYFINKMVDYNFNSLGALNYVFYFIKIIQNVINF